VTTPRLGSAYGTYIQWARRDVTTRVVAEEGRQRMNNIFYVIGVVVVVLAIFGYLRLG
jgi:hypothetical protein